MKFALVCDNGEHNVDALLIIWTVMGMHFNVTWCHFPWHHWTRRWKTEILRWGLALMHWWHFISLSSLLIWKNKDKTSSSLLPLNYLWFSLYKKKGPIKSLSWRVKPSSDTHFSGNKIIAIKKVTEFISCKISWYSSFRVRANVS